MGGVCSTRIFLHCGDGGSCALKQLGKGKEQCSLYQNQESRVFPSDTKLRDSDHEDISKVRRMKKKKTNSTF